MIEWITEQPPALGDAVEWLGETVETYQPTGTLEDLVPSVRPHFDALLAQAIAWGMKPHVRSVGRTCAQQQEQVKLGYSHADLCRSMHVLGHAVDLDLTPNACSTYTKLGQWWEAQGGVWGGRFPGFGDCGDSGHFQYGFSKAGAVPTSVCPSGVTLAQCAKIREAYLDAANAPQVSRNWGLVAGAAVIAVGVAFVWATMRVRPGALAFRENPLVRPSSATPSEEGYLYHATSEDRFADIVASGKLKTHKPWEGTEQDSWPDGSVEKRAYFSPNAAVVWHFAPEAGEAVILRTRRTSAFRRESTGDVYTTKPVPVSALEVLTTEGWVPLAAVRDNPLKKLAAGHYEIRSGDWVCNVSNTGPVPGNSRGFWYWTARQGEDSAGGQDWFAKKTDAIAALEDWLKERGEILARDNPTARDLKPGDVWLAPDGTQYEVLHVGKARKARAVRSLRDRRRFSYVISVLVKSAHGTEEMHLLMTQHVKIKERP